MDKLIKKITVDLARKNDMLPIVYTQQGDNARVVMAAVIQDGLPYIIDTEADVRIYFKKPDGTKVYNDCEFTSNIITISLTNQALAVKGELEAELEIRVGEEKLTTPIFILEVLKSNIDDSAIESSNEFTALDNALAIVQNIIPQTEKGMPMGVANLDESGKIYANQLPSYVDDVMEFNTYANLPATGESGKIYVVLTGTEANKTFRWSGTAYVEISKSLGIGEIAGTAFEGNRGKALETGLAATNDSLAQNTDGIFILPNGLKIMWGKTTLVYATANILEKTIVFPSPFTQDNYNLSVTKHASGGSNYQVQASTGSVSNDKMQGQLRAFAGATAFVSGNTMDVSWLAVGY